MKRIPIFTIFTMLFVFLPFQAWAGGPWYVTQDGAGAKDGTAIGDAWDISQFNALTGIGYAGDMFYFSGTITSEVKPGISGTSGGGYVTLDGYEAGSCDPINATCSSSALIDRNDPLSGTYYGIQTNDQDYLIIQDFRITRCSYGIMGVYPCDSDHIIIKRNHISVCRDAGIYSGGDGYWTIGGALGDGNVIYNIGLGGVFSASCGLRFYGVDDLIASYNWIYNDDETYFGSDAIVVMSSKRHLYEYNTAYNQGEDCIDWKGYSDYLILRFNDFHSTHEAPCKIQRGTDYSYIYGNKFYNASDPNDLYHGAMFYRGADEVKFWANLVYYNRGAGIALFKDSSDTSGDSVSSTGIVIYNNTFVKNLRDGGHSLRSGVFDMISGDHVYKNNIFSQNAWGDSTYRQIYFSSLSSITLDYNLYYYDSSHSPTARIGGTYYTLTHPISGTSFYSATGQEQHGAVGDPLFVDADGYNFRLQSTSPAVNSGVDLSGLAGSMQVQGVTYNMYYDDCLDPDNTDWSTVPPTVVTKKQDDWGASWEKGAYIYTGGGPGPTPNEAPTAIIDTPPGNVTCDDESTGSLEGSYTDADGDTCTFIWDIEAELYKEYAGGVSYALGDLVEDPDAGDSGDFYKCNHSSACLNDPPPSGNWLNAETQATPGSGLRDTPGNYTVSLKVNDGTVDSATVTRGITVLTGSPTGTAIFTRNSSGTPWGFDNHVDTGDATWVSEGTNITVVSSSSNVAYAAGTTGLAITKPASLANDDVLYALLNYADDLGGNWACTGWTHLSNQSTTAQSDMNTSILRKVITNVGGEGASYTFTNTNGTTIDISGCIIAIRGADNTTPEDVTATSSNGEDDDNPDSPTITPTNNGCLILVGCALNNTNGDAGVTYASPTNYILKESESSGRKAQTGLAYYTQTTAGATGAITWLNVADVSKSEWHTYTIAVRSAGQADTNYSSTDYIRVSKTTDSDKEGLIQHDLTSLAGEEVADGTFSLQLKSVGDGTTNIELWSVTDAWTEAGATWNKYDGSNAWTDGDNHTAATMLKEIQFTTSSTVNQYYDWESSELTAYLQSRAGSIAYFLLRGDVSTSSYHFEDDTHDDGTRPKLSVTYGSEAGTVPILVSIECADCDGSYKVNDTIGPFQLNFSETVEYDQTVVLKLDTEVGGANDATTTVNAGSGTAQLSAPAVTVTSDHVTTDLDGLQLDVTAGYLRSVDDSTSVALTGTTCDVFPTGATAGSLASNNNIIIDVTAPAIDGVNNTGTGCSGDDTYTTEGTTIAFAIETNTLLLEITAQPGYPRILTTAIDQDGPVYADVLGFSTDTDWLLTGFPLTYGLRALDLSTSGDLDVGPGGSVTDTAGNPVATSMGALDLAAGAAIVLACHTTAADPWVISSGTYYTTLALIDAATYLLPDDYFKWSNDTVDVFDVSAYDGTSGHEITYDGAGYAITGNQTFGDYSIIKNIVHGSTVVLGANNIHSGSLVPVGDTLQIPEGATGCKIYNDGIGILDINEACADIYNSWFAVVSPTLAADEPVVFTNCHFVESETVIEDKDGDDDLTFTNCTFEIDTAAIFTNYAGGDFTLKSGSSFRHGGTYTVGYETKLAPSRTMEDILTIGPYGVYRGAGGLM